MSTRLRSWLGGGVGLLVSLVAGLVAPVPAALASHSVTALVSAGRNYPYDPCDYPYYVTCGRAIVSRNGEHIVFATPEPLTSADTDSSNDVYDRSGGVTTLISIGPTGGSGAFDASYNAVSADGTRVLFTTRESLVSADTDNQDDVYERSGTTTTLVSTGPTDPGASLYPATFKGVSEDGTRVFFESREQLIPGESDCFALDVWERSGGTTTLLSGNTACTNAFYAGATPSGSHVYFETTESLDGADTDGYQDVYERAGSATTWISTGTLGGNGAFKAEFDAVSRDGSHVFFSGLEKLEPTDLDIRNDLYERQGGTTTLVSTGPSDTHQWPACTSWSADYIGGPCPVRVSDDGSRVFFFTHEGLVPGDTGYFDVYERSGGTTQLVSTGPSGGNGPIPVDTLLFASTDGQHAFFSTRESLVPEDTDSTRTDFYERSGSTTTLVSTGPTDPGGFFFASGNAISENGSRAIFSTTANLVASDTDNLNDIYEREGGQTTLLSTGPRDDNQAYGTFVTASPDAAHVVFHTQDALTTNDRDFCPRYNHACDDLYERRIAGP